MTNLVALLVLLGSENRLRILQALADGPKNVTAINAEVAGTMPTTSQQLQHLLRGGLITLEKRGNQRWYGLRKPVHSLVAATLRALRENATTGEGS